MGKACVYLGDVMVICLFFLLVSCRQSYDMEVTHLPYKADSEERWGLIDWEGNVLIENEFEEKPSPVINGRFYVKNEDGLYEIYTAEKKFKKIGTEYVYVGHFHDGLAPVVEKDSHITYIDKDGKEIFKLAKYKDEIIQYASIFSEGKAVFVTASEKYGYINTKGEVVIEPKYHYASLFLNGSALVADAEKVYSLIKPNGKEYFKFKKGQTPRSLLSEGLVYVAGDNKEYLNEKGETVLKPSSKFEDCSPFYKGTAVFSNSENLRGLMDRNGEIIIRAKYQDLYPCDNFLIFRDKNKSGLISYTGDIICEAEFDKIIPFFPNNQNTYALQGKEWILIGSEGEDLHKRGIEEIEFESLIFDYPYIRLSVESTEYFVHSDYVDIQNEVDRIMEKVKDTGIDQMSFYMSPSEFVRAYFDSYKDPADFKNENHLFRYIASSRYCRISVSVKYNENVAYPQYGKEWKSSYWGRGYYEEVVTGYSFNEAAKVKALHLYIEPKRKLKDKYEEIAKAVFKNLEAKGYLLASDNYNIGTEEWVRFRKEDLDCGVRWDKGGNYIVIGLLKK